MVRAVLCFSFILLGDACITIPALSADENLEPILARLKNWRSTFVNVHQVWEISSATDDSGSSDTHPFSRHEWLWSDDGVRLFEATSFLNSRERPHVRVLDVLDTPQQSSFTAFYIGLADGGERLESLTIKSTAATKDVSSISVLPLTGLYFGGKALWLDEALTELTIQDIRLEEIDGAAYVRIVAKELDGAIFWLDPDHDYLVKRYLMPAVTGGRDGIDFLVRDFRQLESGIWFPQHGRLQFLGLDTSRQRWRVVEAAANIPIRDSRLTQPEPSDGTLVTDAVTQEAYRFPRQTWNRMEAERSIVNTALLNRDPIAPPMSWRLKSGVTLLVASFVFLGAAFCSRGMRRRNEKEIEP